MRFFTDDLPQPARNYLSSITVVGLLIAVYSYTRVILEADGQWLYLALLTAVAAFLPVRLRFSGDQILSVSFTISDVFIFSGLLFFSPEVAVAIGIIDATLVSFQFLHRSRMYRFLFNVAQVSISIFFVGTLFYLIQGHLPPLTGQDSVIQTFLNVGICGFLYVGLNTTAVATAMFLSSPGAGTEVWRASIVPSAFSTLAGALTAASIFFTLEQELLFGVAISLPLILVLYISYRMANERVEGLLESRSLLQDSLDAIESYIAVLDESGVIITANQSWKSFGVSGHLFGEDLAVGMNYLDELDSNLSRNSDATTSISQGIRQVIAFEKPEFSCTYSTATTSSTSWLVVRVTRFKSQDPIRVVVAHEDITERQRAEQGLRLSEERYRRFFEDDLTGDFTARLNGDILTCNTAFTRMFGFESLQHAESSNLFSLFPGQQQTIEFLELLRSQKKLEYHEIELRRITGDPVYVVANVTGSFDERGFLSRVRGYLFDDTARKALEAELRQAQKMEAVGQLAGGIAHDLNNILTVIMGYAEFLKDSLWESSEARGDAQTILDSVDRAQGLTHKLLTFSRHQVLQPATLDMNKVVRDFSQLLRRIIRANIRIETKLDPKISPVRMDPGQMDQVLMNLSVNAQDAMAEGGALTIRTAKRSVEEGQEDVPANLKAGEYVVISVIDEGEGIPDKVRERVFEPFFTTKSTGQGTGLGLSIVYGIITQGGGQIQIRKGEEKGTVFEIWLPAGQPVQVPGPAAPEEIALARKGGDETILLVEDENRILELISEILRRKGYTVFEAADGEKALPLTKRLGAFDLLITDLIMPVMGGWELARELRKTRDGKDLRVLYISGYPDTINPELLKGGSAGVSFLAKPFTPDALLQKVREILSPSRDA